MAKRKRRKFTAGFKADAVRLCIGGGRSIGQVATDLDLTETALREWVRRSEADAGKGNPEVLTTAEREELRQLRRDNKRLLMERDILKNGPGLRPTCWTRSSPSATSSAGSEGAAACFLVTLNP